MKLPIRTLGLAAGALLIGSALAPVSAQQQQSGVDGQVALRSDGALYLITNGQRRWISTVAATDEEINALPEGEPVYAGLAPQGATQASAAPTKPSTTGTTASKTGTKPATKAASKTRRPSRRQSSRDDAATTSSRQRSRSTLTSAARRRSSAGDARTVEIKTRRDATCDLVVNVPGDDDITEDSKNADSRGRCVYTIEIPSGTDEGDGKVIGTVREGGKVNRQEISIKIENSRGARVG